MLAENMTYTVYEAKVTMYDTEEQKHQTLIATGTDYCQVYNWCIDQIETFRQYNHKKHVHFLITEDDSYTIWAEVTNDEEEKTETERQTEETTESYRI